MRRTASLSVLLRPLDLLHGHLFGWVPVALGAGIGLYFSLLQEPAGAVYLWAAAGTAVVGLVWWRGPHPLRPVMLGAGLVAVGLLLAGARAHLVAAPVLSFRYYGPVEGRVLLIDRSGSDQLRLTLDRVVLERMDPARTPARVRITAGGAQDHIHLEPGQRVMLTAFLQPPEGPVEPGGFDFQRMAWFLRLGAVGFSRSPVMALAPPEPGQAGLVFARLRQQISDAVRRDFPGDAGGFVTAVLTNDTSGLSREALDSLRASSLAHILSISGLHMSLLAAFVFAALRHGIALVPVVALRVSSKKIAAWVALAATAFYYGLSGGAVATQRSFVMIAVMLVAVLVDRRAISLRSVAIAAVVVLVVQPESLLSPGFQMSFAATVALVAAFGALHLPDGFPRWLRPVAGLILASVVAGAATGPFGAAAFNKLSGYGLLANMAAEPLMALVVMPGTVFAAVLAPLGLAGPVLWLMVQAARVILWVSDAIAGLDGAVVGVVSPPQIVLPLIALGGLVLVLVPYRARWAGVVPVVVALVLWMGAARPALLISADGAVAGLMTSEGRAFSASRGATFVARNWLEDDGDLAPLKDARRRAGFTVAADGSAFSVGGRRGMLVSADLGTARLAALCGAVDLLIVAPSGAVPELADSSGPCRMIGPAELRQLGPVAVQTDAGGLRLTGARQVQGARLWSGRPAPARRSKAAEPALAVGEAAVVLETPPG